MGDSGLRITFEDAERSRSQFVILNSQVLGIANQANGPRSQIVTLNVQVLGTIGQVIELRSQIVTSNEQATDIARSRTGSCDEMRGHP